MKPVITEASALSPRLVLSSNGFQRLGWSQVRVPSENFPPPLPPSSIPPFLRPRHQHHHPLQSSSSSPTTTSVVSLSPVLEFRSCSCRIPPWTNLNKRPPVMPRRRITWSFKSSVTITVSEASRCYVLTDPVSRFHRKCWPFVDPGCVFSQNPSQSELDEMLSEIQNIKLKNMWKCNINY